MSKYSAARDLDLKARTKWYVFANRSEAVIYKDSHDHKFQFIERMLNPEGNLAEQDLDSDRPGRGFSSADGVFHHALDRRYKRHETLAKRFALAIGRTLEVAQREGRFSELVVAAEPHFLGLLRELLPAAVRHVITSEVPREYSQGSDQELRTQILRAIESMG